LHFQVIKSYVLFFFAGLAEIAGGYFIWLWLREDAPLYFGILGDIILVAYGIIPTLQHFPDFGRIYAAYGGIFIIMALFWGWWIDGKQPDFFDWTGMLVALLGTTIILWAPRKQGEDDVREADQC